MKKLLLSAAALLALGMTAPAYAHCGMCDEKDNHGAEAVDAEHAAEKHMGEAAEAVEEHAEDAAHDAAEHVEEHAEEAAEDAMDHAEDAAHNAMEDHGHDH